MRRRCHENVPTDAAESRSDGRVQWCDTGPGDGDGTTQQSQTTVRCAWVGNGDGDAAGEEAFVFEGPEKCLEVDFCVGSGPIDGLRAIPRPLWDELLASCGCEIISVKSNEEIDSYVLSESSLFVYRWKMVLKTCGKTTPLQSSVVVVIVVCGTRWSQLEAETLPLCAEDNKLEVK